MSVSDASQCIQQQSTTPFFDHSRATTPSANNKASAAERHSTAHVTMTTLVLLVAITVAMLSIKGGERCVLLLITALKYRGMHNYLF